jgi:hypothetical protein
MLGLDLNKVIFIKNFLFYVYVFFSGLCKTPPKLRERQDKRTNKIYFT